MLHHTSLCNGICRNKKRSYDARDLTSPPPSGVAVSELHRPRGDAVHPVSPAADGHLAPEPADGRRGVGAVCGRQRAAVGAGRQLRVRPGAGRHRVPAAGGAQSGRPPGATRAARAERERQARRRRVLPRRRHGDGGAARGGVDLTPGSDAAAARAPDRRRLTEARRWSNQRVLLVLGIECFS